MEALLDTVLENINWVTAVVALVTCLAAFVLFQWIHMPPGPVGLPYLGYYPFLRKDFSLHLQNMTKKYGDVFCINCTGQLYVYLGRSKVIKEAHVTKSECFAGRSTRFSLVLDSFGGGVSLENGDKWKELRKFFILKLKELGSGKKTQESLMGDYLDRTLNTIRESDGENFDALAYFTNISSKIVFAMLLSGTKADDDYIKTYNDAYAVLTATMLGKTALLSGPLLKLMIHVHPEFRRYRKNRLHLDAILTKTVEEHEKHFDKDNIRDLVDCFIAMRKQLEEKNDPRSKTYTGKALRNSLIQFLGDGGFSVGFIVAMVLKEAFSRPEMQKEIQREIDEIIGHSRLPSLDDKSRMPYTNAFIQECFRRTEFFPALPSLECTKETTVGDCRVPKGTITLVGFWASSNDPDVYPQPENFDPKRFLPNDEKKPRCELPLFFGAGKRSCVGELLVIMETFLFVTTVLQNFDLSPAEEAETPESTPKETSFADFGVVFRAKPRKP